MSLTTRGSLESHYTAGLDVKLKNNIRRQPN